MNLPKTRADLLVQDLRDEVLIYDKSTNKSYCLNSTARTVFDACDGVKTFADVNLPEEIIYLSLDELKKQNLIHSDYVSPFAGMNRREVIKRVGLASMIALPVISSLVAPSAARAASGRQANGTTCTSQRETGSTECKSGRCTATRAYTYNPASSSPGGLRCCGAADGNFTGSYTRGNSFSGACYFEVFCCTGRGTESYDALNNQYYCTCDATS